MALKLATSLDGRIADRFGRSRWISGEPARDYVHWLRAGMGAIGVGGATARADDPSLTVRGAIEPRTVPLRVVFRPGWQPPHYAGGPPDRPRATDVRGGGSALSSERAEAIEGTGARLLRTTSLHHGLTELRRLGIASIVVEGGGQLAGALLGEGLVDRYYWIQSPVWLGEGGVPGGWVARRRAGHGGALDRRRAQGPGRDTLLVADRG